MEVEELGLISLGKEISISSRSALLTIQLLEESWVLSY